MRSSASACCRVEIVIRKNNRSLNWARSSRPRVATCPMSEVRILRSNSANLGVVLRFHLPPFFPPFFFSVYRVIGVWQQESGKGPRLANGAAHCVPDLTAHCVPDLTSRPGPVVFFYGCFLVIEAHGGTWFRTPCPIVVRSRSKC